MTAPHITTDRLILRAPAPRDAGPAIAFWESDRADHVGGARPRAQGWRSFAMVLGHWQIRGFGLFAVCRHQDDIAIGLIGPWFPEGWKEHEIGWLILSPDLEGTGIAFEAATAARAYAYDTLNWTTAVSYIAPENTRSRRLAERLGAQLDETAEHGFDDPCVVYRHPSPEALQ